MNRSFAVILQQGDSPPLFPLASFTNFPQMIGTGHWCEMLRITLEINVLQGHPATWGRAWYNPDASICPINAGSKKKPIYIVAPLPSNVKMLWGSVKYHVTRQNGEVVQESQRPPAPGIAHMQKKGMLIVLFRSALFSENGFLYDG